ncbi:MFS transporter [Crepidotus variabilis]|uniref:MFS transporter n=1 Tax=Crepidotus variabilis TaxID=179855 RepID=A0A9P6E7J1_9AGAR|nr:MFS transporter [Crepidotus variabilis]
MSASIKSTPSINSTSDSESQKKTRRILRKLDAHLLPSFAFLWLANFIDRSNIGNARIAGLEHDTKLIGNQFNVVLVVFYVAYLSVELPSNVLLQKLKPNRWIPMTVIAWGTVTTLTSLVQNFKGVIVVRIFLGLCEGGILPSMMVYLSTLYKREELQFRVAIFYTAASLAGAFGGLLATGIQKMDGIGGLAGWRWIFILEGLATIIAGIAVAFILPESLAKAHFLTEEERIFAVRRYHMDDVTLNSPASPELGTPEEKVDKEIRVGNLDLAGAIHRERVEDFEWREIIRGFADPQSWLLGFSYCGLLVGLNSYSLFLPTIISGLGYSGPQAQLHTVPPYVPAAILTLIIAFLADRLKLRGPFVLMVLPLAMIGYIIAICAKANSTRYVAVFFMAAGVYPSGPCFLAILANNTSGRYKKATSIAIQIAIANSAGFIAPFAYTPDQAPKYIRGHIISLAFVCFTWTLVACNVVYCWWENKARADGRRQSNIDKYNALFDSRKTKAPIGDRHPDFKFVL